MTLWDLVTKRKCNVTEPSSPQRQDLVFVMASMALTFAASAHFEASFTRRP